MAANNNIRKISKFIQANPEIDGIVITDPENLAYATGLNFQALASIKNLRVIAFFSEKKRFLACPKILVSAYHNAGWHDSIVAYANGTDPEASAVSVSAAFISELFSGNTASIGYMADSMNQTMYEKLSAKLSGFNFVDITESFLRLREIKSGFERQVLAQAAALTDHSIASAIHHVSRNGVKGEKILTQDIRVHALERGMPVEGYRAVSQAVSEENATILWPHSPYYAVGRDGSFYEGKFIRLEMCGMLHGYWSNDSRMMVKGDMNMDQKKFAEDITTLRKFACAQIHPGVRAKEVFQAIADKAIEMELNLAVEYGFGHGIGVAPVEAPFISAADETVLEKDMVLVLALPARYTTGGGELYIMKDTIIITEDGCKIVGRYENWDYPYTAAYTF